MPEGIRRKGLIDLLEGRREVADKRGDLFGLPPAADEPASGE